MAKSKSILGAELAELPLEEMVLEAMSGCGVSIRTGVVMVGTIELTVLIGLGVPGEESTAAGAVREAARMLSQHLSAPEGPSDEP